MGRRTSLILIVVCVALPSTALAGEEVLVFDGEVEPGGLDHEFVEFEVPEGVVEIEVRHDDMSEANILDWGVYDAAGFRGWGGGNSEPAVIGIDAASRSYVPGAIEAGTWRVVIGKAKIVESPAPYHIEVVLRGTATLEPQPERMPYAAVEPLSTEARWYAGDFHVHSRESGDASPPIDEIATFARGRGLDFVELSDHNVVTQSDFIGAAQPDHPELLLLPGIEFTTYAGHANAVGATVWVDHKIGQPDVTIDGAIAAIHDQGALVSINHPVLALGDLCIGCAWEHEVDPLSIDAVEIATTGLDAGGALFTGKAIEYWDDLCDAGSHAAAIGGSDDHSAGLSDGAFNSPIGDPTTMVYANELSVAAILDGIRASRTVVKLQGPDDPMIDFMPTRDRVVDTIYADTPVTYDVVVTGGEGLQVRAVRDGTAGNPVDIDADPFMWSFDLDSPDEGETRIRIEVVQDNAQRVVTSHIWQRRCDDTNCSDSAGTTTGTVDDTGPDPTTEDGPDPTASTSTSADADASTSTAGTTESDSGCSCTTSPPTPPWWLLALTLVRPRRASLTYACGARRRPSKRRRPTPRHA